MAKLFVFTSHAQQVIRERGIELEWIERVIRSPQRVEKDKSDARLSHHLGKIAERNSRVLHVVLDCDASPIRVITAYFDRNLRNKL
ncbi:MAG: DUF4258 domain-containing protein [Pseudomonadota bacterium]|nr:DUF4258 domain-containing protein [Pseudomonadota bacterium]